VIGREGPQQAREIRQPADLRAHKPAAVALSLIVLYSQAMASRRLALNIKQALRSKAALNSIQPRIRGFATPIHQGINTESTTLANGLTV